MKQLIGKTFGGLTPRYYIRNFIFGLIFPALYVMMVANAAQNPNAPHDLLSIGHILFLAVNTLLYPYARFAYEGVVGFILGNNLFILNALVMLAVKFITMTLCWAFAIFIAPLGLAYLYWHHSRPARNAGQ